jgi:phenylpyruvate tautomerase PptA (4-oxalocrotonate tautomerase family)
MPLYTAITQEGALSNETKAKIAEEITRIHCGVMKVPKNFVRVVFLSYPKGSGFAGGSEAPAAALNCVLRSGHTFEEKTDMLKRLWAMFQGLTGIATDQLALSLQEIPILQCHWRWGKSCPRSETNGCRFLIKIF